MQYFAPLSIGPQAGLSTVVPPNADNDSEPKTTNAPPTRHRQFQWLNREIIEEKDPSGPNDKLNNYLSSGDAVGGVVTSGSLLLLIKKICYKIRDYCVFTILNGNISVS